MPEPIGPNRAGPVGHPPDPGRRHQAVHQGGPDPRPGRPAASSGWRRTCRRARRSWCSRSCRSAATSTTASDGIVSIFGHETYLQLADPPIGILLLLAMSSIAVYGVMLAGWSSGSKYPLLGSVRASAQMVSYEAALGLSLVAVVLVTGSLSTHDIVVTQAGDGLLGDRPQLEHHRHRRGAVRDLPHRRHRRAEPAAVRPRRGRAGAGRRLQHRVQLDPLRPLLPRRVHGHDHHSAPSSSPCSSAARPARPAFGPAGSWGPIWFFLKLSSSCSFRSGSGPRCPGSATTS